jgi:hypothetical protein
MYSVEMWRNQALQVPDLRIIKGKRRATSFSAIRAFVVASRGRGGGSSGVVVLRGRGDVSSHLPKFSE